jgi:phage tail sheath protein FI
MATPYKNRSTPGVYVTELGAFPTSIVGVQTSVPAFIGYTEKALVNGKPTLFTPITVTSMVDFETIFGGAFAPAYRIVPVSPSSANPDFEVGQNGYQLRNQARFILHACMSLFFANGGANCYVISVGDYSSTVSESILQKGLDAANVQVGATMLVIPEATLLASIADFGTLAQAMLQQCGSLQDRVAILDVWGAETVSLGTIGTQLTPVIDAFKTSLGIADLSYGVAYFPLLNTAIARADSVNYTSFAIPATPAPDAITLQQLLSQEADTLCKLGSPSRATMQGYIDLTNTLLPDGTAATAAKIATLNQQLSTAIPAYAQWQNVILQRINLLPPSAALAGVFTASDQAKGVWAAPTDISLKSTISCSVNLNDTQQSDLNTPLDGQAVNVIRDIVNSGSIVWGARTLDGNSPDWRYIPARRTTIYIEQSIKQSLNPFIFAANDAQTWVTVTSMVSNFLHDFWLQGGLMGDTPSAAYSVQCGLGSTMSAQDILNGSMTVQVGLAIIFPAEFIELTFRRQMQGA